MALRLVSVEDLGQQGPPLNYFIHPYAEVAGTPHDGISARVTLRDL